MLRQMVKDMKKSSPPLIRIIIISKLRLMGMIMIIKKRRNQMIVTYLEWLKPSTFHPTQQ